MKNLILLSMLFLPYFLGAQIPFPLTLQQEEKAIKKAKIKTIHVYRQTEGEEKNLVEILTYNKKGQLLQKEEKGTYNGDLNTSFSYHTNGSLIKMQTENEGESFQSTTDYLYEKNRLIGEKHKMSDEEGNSMEYTIAYSYNTQGQIDSSFLADAEFRQNVWSYNQDGKLASILGYTIYDFDSPDNWVKVDELSYEYNTMGLLSKSKECYSSMGCNSNRYSYNSKQQKIKVIDFNDEDQEAGKSEFEYNKKGLLIKKIYVGSENSMYPMPNFEMTYEYTF